MLGVVALTLAGCSSDDGDAESGDDTSSAETTEAPSDAAVELAQGYRSFAGEDLVTEEESLCFATALIDGLGEDRTRELDSGAIDLADLDPAEQDAFAAANDDCIPGTVFAKDFVAGVFSELTVEPADGTVECVGEQLDGLTGTLIIEGIRSGDTGELPETALDAIDACVDAEAVSSALQTEFAAQGLDQAVSTCVADRLATEVTFGQLARLGTGDAEVAATFEQLSSAAVQACS